MDIKPTMEQHTTLNLLLDSLFSNNSLKNWSVFEETNGFTVLKLRFTKSDNTTATTSSQSFRRKSDAQSQRDRDRAARHRDARAGATTRSQTSTGLPAESSPELPRDSESISVSETRQPLEVSPVQLNPGAQSFNPESVNQKHHNSTAGDLFTEKNDSLLSVESADMDTAGADRSFENSDASISMESERTADEQSMVNYITDIKKISCAKCYTSYSAAVRIYDIKMMWCDKCEIYVCEHCYDRSTHVYKCKKRVKVIDIKLS